MHLNMIKNINNNTLKKYLSKLKIIKRLDSNTDSVTLNNTYLNNFEIFNKL